MGVESDWYLSTLTWRTAPLIPAAQLWAFWANISQKKRISAHRFPCLIIAIGNVTVGGTGKTPLTLFLANALRARGISVGIVSRGYPASPRAPRIVQAGDAPSEVGDEPLLYARAGHPICVCAQRVSAVEKLLSVSPTLQVILADDALSHYALPRNLEIGVVDGNRKFGNGRFLPAGPLRESPERLALCDAVVVNGGPTMGYANEFTMQMTICELRTLEGAPVVLVLNERITVLAGIGNPGRYFSEMAIFAPQVLIEKQVALPDHAEISAEILNAQPSDTIVVTEKDAVKIARIVQVVNKKILVAHTQTRVTPDLVEWLLQRIQSSQKQRGPKTA